MINKAEIQGNGNILIQDSDNSEIIINTDNSKEIRKFLLDFQNRLADLPKEIIELMQSKNPNQAELEPGANIYLSLNFMINTGFTTGIGGISFGVTITNLTKENRFYNAPFFKSSVPFDGNLDTFSLTEKTNNIGFPKKLEYGEPVSEFYIINPNSKHLYETLLSKDEEATIQAIVTTTLVSCQDNIVG